MCHVSKSFPMPIGGNKFDLNLWQQYHFEVLIITATHATTHATAPHLQPMIHTSGPTWTQKMAN